MTEQPSSESTDALSVLALSSRFDGLDRTGKYRGTYVFQYSLCRVVLMVTTAIAVETIGIDFQYSLCRVVLMVPIRVRLLVRRLILSVLALSSRFDGHCFHICTLGMPASFSTRSVESF